MLTIAEKYANEHSISFSTDVNPNKSKTKGMIFCKHETDLKKYKPVVLSEKELPWVSASKYLGHKLTDRINGLSNDISEKRAKYIQRNCELLQEFPFSHPEFKCKINHINNSSFTSSVLWDLTSENTQRIIWSRSVRHMWDLPLQTHRYFIEPLGGTHLQTMLYTRFTKFIHSINNGIKDAPIYLLHLIKDNTDNITGRNIREILNVTNESNISNVTVSKLKEKKFSELPKNEDWRIKLVKELTNIKMKNLGVCFNNGDELSKKEINDMIFFTTTM